jgi:hypothetical protein
MFGEQRTRAVSADPNDVARLREALASLAGKGSGSVDPERVFDALHGNLSAEERRAVVDELVVNPDAAETWRLARELAPEPAAAAVPTGRETWRWLSIAAAAVLAVGLAWRFLGPPGSPEEPAYRSVEQRTITSLLPQGAVLSRTQPVLRWTAVEGARYRVRVLTSDLEVLQETGELTGPEYTLSADVLRRIPSGGQFLWQVEGRVRGSAAIVSPTFNTRVE